MSQAQKTFEVYTQIGILTDCVSMSTRYDVKANLWIVSGKFQNKNGIKIGQVAKFDLVDDALEFMQIAGF
jgi:hypothetical protein